MELCPACGCSQQAAATQSFTEPLAKTTYRLYRCPGCDLEFWAPLVMPDGSYYEQAVGEYEHYHKGDDLSLRWWHRAFLRDFPSTNIPGRILDIGCADGRFLRTMKDKGWSVCGVDFDRRSVETARRTCGTSEIYHGSLDEVVGQFEAGLFDVVTFFEVLEHQVNPIGFLQRVKTLMKRGGTVGGSVPNRLRYVIPTRHSPDLPPHHFTLWTPEVLRRFFERQGFSDVRTSSARYEPILLDQAIRHVMHQPLRRAKLRLGVRSFESADYDSPANAPGRLLTAAKRFVWNPIMAVLTLPEYPVLWLSGRGISLCFIAGLGAAGPDPPDDGSSV